VLPYEEGVNEPPDGAFWPRAPHMALRAALLLLAALARGSLDGGGDSPPSSWTLGQSSGVRELPHAGRALGWIDSVTQRHHPCDTAISINIEPTFTRLIASLFRDGQISNGSIIDCGAHKGGESCAYADLDERRKVHAIEPLAANVKRIRDLYHDRPNLLPMHAALGSVARTVDAAEAESHRSATMLHDLHRARSSNRTTGSNSSAAGSNSSFQVHRLDDLFGSRWADERLAFAHFDVEGSEADVLRGAALTIRRDRPIFTAEVAVLDRRAVSELLGTVDWLGYSAYGSGHLFLCGSARWTHGVRRVSGTSCTRRADSPTAAI